MDTAKTNSPRRGRIDPIWWAPVLFIVIAALITMTALLFSGTLRNFVPVTLVADRAGLVMENGAKVKLRGVQIGEVASIGAHSSPDGTDHSTLNLKIYPGQFPYLPSNVEAEIKSSTAFGAKYVDLIVPDSPSPQPLASGAVLHSRNVTVEVNTVFENLQSVVHAIDPAKLNAVLSAVAEALRGKGDRHRSRDHRCQQRAAGRQPADADRAAGLAAVRQDRTGVFGCGAEYPVDSGFVLDDQYDDHRPRGRARHAAVVRGRLLAGRCQHDRRKPAQPGACDEHPRSDDRVC